jgi:hypothetical protein
VPSPFSKNKEIKALDTRIEKHKILLEENENEIEKLETMKRKLQLGEIESKIEKNEKILETVLGELEFKNSQKEVYEAVLKTLYNMRATLRQIEKDYEELHED